MHGKRPLLTIANFCFGSPAVGQGVEKHQRCALPTCTGRRVGLQTPATKCSVVGPDSFEQDRADASEGRLLYHVRRRSRGRAFPGDAFRLRRRSLRSRTRNAWRLRESPRRFGRFRAFSLSLGSRGEISAVWRATDTIGLARRLGVAIPSSTKTKLLPVRREPESWGGTTAARRSRDSSTARNVEADDDRKAKSLKRARH